MNIEEQAEEYIMREDVVTENDRVPLDNGYGWQTVSFEDEVKQAFQDGAKWGMEHAIEWHDIRENPDDLPKRESKYFSWSITVANQLGEACHYNYRKSCWETPLFTEIEGVIRWCELPQFKE